jgi:hypothetical protein
MGERGQGRSLVVGAGSPGSRGAAGEGGEGLYRPKRQARRFTRIKGGKIGYPPHEYRRRGSHVLQVPVCRIHQDEAK